MEWKRSKFFSGSAKQSAEGVTKEFSSNHRFQPIFVSKKSLSGCDDKRFILSDQVSTLPYGHSAIREDMFLRAIVDEPDWGPDDFSESERDSSHQAQDISQQAQDTSQPAQDSSHQAKDSSKPAQDSTQQAQVARSRLKIARSRRRMARSRHRIACSRRRIARSRPSIARSRRMVACSRPIIARSRHRITRSRPRTALSRLKQNQQTQQSANIPQTNSILSTSFNSIPYLSFHQREYSKDALKENVVDFDKLSKLSESASSTDPACDVFVLSQAEESNTERQLVALPNQRQNRRKDKT